MVDICKKCKTGPGFYLSRNLKPQALPFISPSSSPLSTSSNSRSLAYRGLHPTIFATSAADTVAFASVSFTASMKASSVYFVANFEPSSVLGISRIAFHRALIGAHGTYTLCRIQQTENFKCLRVHTISCKQHTANRLCGDSMYVMARNPQNGEEWFVGIRATFIDTKTGYVLDEIEVTDTVEVDEMLQLVSEQLRGSGISDIKHPNLVSVLKSCFGINTSPDSPFIEKLSKTLKLSNVARR